jgi:PAS domain S-box-containing protein
MTNKKRPKGRTVKSLESRDRGSGVDLSLAALDAVEESVHVIDSDLRILLFNCSFREWCRNLKIDVDNVVGKNLFDVFGFLPDQVRDEYARVFKTGKSMTTEETVRVGGRVIFTRTRKHPIFRGKKVTHVVTIVADISDYSVARKELKASVDQYRLVMENIPVTVAIIDHDGIFHFINAHGAKSLGAAPKDILGSTIFDYFPSDLAKRHIGYIRQVIRENTHHAETVRTHVGGRWGWYDVIVQPYIMIDGAMTALVISNDITRYKEAIDALKKSEERFRRQFQASPLPTYIWEFEKNEFRLTEYNRAAYTITKGRIEDFIGMTASKMYAHMPMVIKDLHRCLKQEKTLKKDMPYQFQATGENKFLAVYYVYVPPNQVLVHTEDITERRQARDALQRAHDDLERRVRERTDELATINETLRVERESLRQKNIALNEVLAQIEQGKRELGMQIQANINRIALPILKSLETRVDQSGRQYINLLHTSLSEIAAPLTRELEKRFADLTPRELEICHMIRNGLNCKDIAATFNTALQTVLKQRAAIRKKIGIANKKINLETFLKSL